MRPDDFELMSGVIKSYKSSENGNRGFCEDCGSTLTFYFDSQPHEMDVSAATLDDPNIIQPKDHVWAKSKLDWVHLDDGLPQLQKDHIHERYPDN